MYSLKKYSFLVFIFLVVLGCKKNISERIPINILFAKKPTFLINEQNKLSLDAQTLLGSLEGDELKCPHGFILDPILKRVDFRVDTSIVESVEKSPIAAPLFVRDAKLNKEHLGKVTVPTKLLQVANQESDSLFTLEFEKFSKDSIIVLVSNKSIDSVKINGIRMKAYSDISALRLRMLSILCQNPKATLSLIIDPPIPTDPLKLRITSVTPDCEKGQLTVNTIGGDGSPITFSTKGLKPTSKAGKFVVERNQRNGNKFTFYATQKGVTAETTYVMNCPIGSSDDTGQSSNDTKRKYITQITWTRLPGSEFCVGECIQAYSERSNLGQVRERRTTNCAECKSVSKERK